LSIRQMLPRWQIVAVLCANSTSRNGRFLVIMQFARSLIGLLAGIVSDRFDQMNAITNFVVTPLSFLSGTFYSVDILPPVLRTITQFNPVFYLIDGFRYGITGVSDASPVTGALFCGGLCLGLGVWGWRWFSTGYRLKD